MILDHGTTKYPFASTWISAGLAISLAIVAPAGSDRPLNICNGDAVVLTPQRDMDLLTPERSATVVCQVDES
jgi:hypothetical protein